MSNGSELSSRERLRLARDAAQSLIASGQFDDETVRAYERILRDGLLQKAHDEQSSSLRVPSLSDGLSLQISPVSLSSGNSSL